MTVETHSIAEPGGPLARSCGLEEMEGGTRGWWEEGKEEKRERGAKAVSLRLCFHNWVRLDLFRDMKPIIFYTSDLPAKLYDNFGID